MTFRIKSSKNSRKNGALWHSIKQRVDIGFKTTFAFKFRNQFCMGGGIQGGMDASVASGSIMGSPKKGGTFHFSSNM